MCDIPSDDTIINKNDVGVIFMSTQCGCLNVCLRNVCLHIDRESLIGFTQMVEDIYHRNAHHDEDKIVRVSTPYAGLNFYFTLEDIKLIINLTSEAELLLSAMEIVNSAME